MAEDNGTMQTPQTQEGTEMVQAPEQPQTRRGGRPPGNKAQQAARAANAADVQPAAENGQQPKTSWSLSEVVEIRSILEEALVEKETQIDNLKEQLQNYKMLAGEYFMVQRTLQQRGVDIGGS